MRLSRPVLIALAVVLAAVSLVRVTITGPRISVRWAEGIAAPERDTLERRFDLRDGEPDRQSPATWQYELGTRSRANIEALVRHPSVEDTHNVDRDRMTAPGPSMSIGLRPVPALPFPFSETPEFPDAAQLFQLQSGCLMLAGGVLLWAARRPSRTGRRNLTIAALVFTGATALALPISPLFVTMSDANQHVENRRLWEDYAGVGAVRFEAHLTYAILGRLDALYGAGPDAPASAVATVARAATVLFVLSALGVGLLEAWSPTAVRYLALGLLAPAALLYFGWREFGYLALNIAAYPLLRRGLRTGAWHVEAGGALSGLCAAFHGWGLVSLASAWTAALATPAPWVERAVRVLRLAAFGTAAYVGWVAIYVIVLKLPVSLGHVGAIPWRPWFADVIFDDRINPAIFSPAGMRILVMTAWVVGASLIAVAVSLWRQHRQEVLIALAYAVPSLVLMVLVFHTQGLHEDMDVIVGIFPGIYALAWVCAHDARRSTIAAALLVSGHLAFWRIVLDGDFRSVSL